MSYSLFEQLYEPELAQFVPPEETAENDTQRCEICKYYVMIDSGYGYCKRFPPKSVSRKKYFWQSLKESIEFQITEWCRKACGEFRSNCVKIKN